MRTKIALALAASLLLATPALAADRSDRSRDGGTPTPPPVVIPTPTPQPTFPNINQHNTGGISSSAGVSTNSGGNQGGSVSTGDQTGTVNVVNIGPVNNNTQVVVTGSQPTPEPGPATICSNMRGCRSDR